EWTVALLVGIMVVNVAMGVFFRYVLHNSIFWTEELGRYMMIWMAYLGAVLATREEAHVGITAVVALLPPTGRRIMEFFTRLIVIAFLVIVLVKSFAHLDSLSIQKSSAMEIPMAIPYLAVTVGLFLMTIENVLFLIGFRWEPELPVESK
ncbi:MAG: TRAP transporter small permease, partial [Spirochaetales bacterium]